MTNTPTIKTGTPSVAPFDPERYFGYYDRAKEPPDNLTPELWAILRYLRSTPSDLFASGNNPCDEQFTTPTIHKQSSEQ